MRAVVVLVLAGCVRGPAPTSEPARQKYTAPYFEDLVERGRQVERYCNALFAESDLAPIAGKLPFNMSVEDITADMRANTNTATDEEKRAVRALVERHAACHEKETMLIGSLSGPPSMWYSRQRERHLASLKELYEGKLTYGDFNASLQTIETEAKRERQSEELTRVNRTQEASARSSEERARRALDVHRAYQEFVETRAAPPAP